MTKHVPRLVTRREFWPTAAGMFSLVVGCSRRQSVTEIPLTTLPPSESRTITHALGNTRVPQVPQRIVALTGTSDLESLLVLGIKPFAAAGDDRRFGQSVWQPHMADQMQGVEMLPSRRNISLEKVATLQPDLIIGASAQIKAVYPRLSQIAPTVALDTNQLWQENLRLVAKVVDEPEQAEAWIMAFEQRLATLADTYHEKISGITYTTANYQPGRRQFDMVLGRDLDQAFQEIGLTRPPEQTRIIAQQESSRRRANISLERLDLIDTDLLFFYHYDYPTIQKAHELPELNRFLEAEPLLRSLQAVKNRRVFIVPAYYWFLGRAMGIPMAVDDLEASVLPLIT
ncbi:MAG: iron-siderophore ABC transporter substrate-binding protein [Cyanobacteria bacterium P01_H01_bin.21]